MPSTTIALGAALIVLGLGGYGLTGAASLTALIPAAFGLLLVVAGVLARDDRKRMHAIQTAVVIALLGFLGSVRGLLRIGDVFHATSARPAAIVAQSIMAVLTLAYIVIAVRSFIQARQGTAHCSLECARARLDDRARRRPDQPRTRRPGARQNGRAARDDLQHQARSDQRRVHARRRDAPATAAPDCDLDLQATIAVIREHNPDIVGVQEVDRFWARSGYVDQPEALRPRSG